MYFGDEMSFLENFHLYLIDRKRNGVVLEALRGEGHLGHSDEKIEVTSINPYIINPLIQKKKAVCHLCMGALQKMQVKSSLENKR